MSGVSLDFLILIGVMLIDAYSVWIEGAEESC